MQPKTQAPRFYHLRVHTEHSLPEGAVPVQSLIKLCAAAKMPAVAVTDTNTSAHWNFRSMQGAGL